MDKIPLIFQAKIVEHTPMENSGFTSCRARVFYTGLNRNGSYIDKQFAEILIGTASGCPVVGLWDYEKHDFTDHSPSDRKRAYGFIPENPNFAWETSLDYDGVEREYASFDIILWTKAFEEANEIINHPLSMELNPDSINGSFSVVNGEYCFYFTSAELLGVCVLGYGVEPCFEGAKFITLEEANEFKRLFKLDKEEALKTYNAEKDKGEPSMGEEKEKDEILDNVEEFTQIRDEDIEVEEPIEESPSEPTSDYKLDEPVESEPEPEEDPKEKFVKMVAELEQQNEDFKNKIQELENKVTKLEEENFSLNEFKQNKEKEEKLEVLNSYSDVLTKEETDGLNIDEFSKDDLSDKLAAMAYRKIANHKSADFQLINTNINPVEKDDISSIVKRYKEEN